MQTKESFSSLGDLGILKTLPLHHVAPVAGRIADRKKNGSLFITCPLNRFFAPRIPVDRIVGVLQQIGTAFLGQAI